MNNCNGEHEFWKGCKKGEGDIVYQHCRKCDGWFEKPLRVSLGDALYQAVAMKREAAYEKMVKKFRKVRL